MLHSERIVSANVDLHAADPAEVEEVCQVLEGERQCGQVFPGCKETRQSSSAGVKLFGSHMVNAKNAQATYHCVSQRRNEIVRCSTGCVKVKGNRVDDV